jgi:hypothetical protein
VQRIRQHAHMPARDDNGSGGEQAGHLGAVPGDHRPVVRPQALVELAADGADAAQVRGVEFPDGAMASPSTSARSR